MFTNTLNIGNEMLGSVVSQISMWLGFHDELAEPKSDDPLARLSIRIVAVGTMGGHVQPQILAQVFSHLMAGASAQDAVGRPRFVVGAWDEGDPLDALYAEDDGDPDVMHELDSYSGPLHLVPPLNYRLGHAHAIRATASDTTTEPDAGTGFDTGSDPRADG